MACYIASNDNRFYVALESSYGAVPSVTNAHRISATKLMVEQEVESPTRRDKTGSRTFGGTLANPRKRTQFGLKSQLVNWPDGSVAPSYGRLFESGMGGSVKMFSGRTVHSVPATNRIKTTAAHGLSVGQGVAFGGEIRFVTGLPDTTTIEINVPFSLTPSNGSTLGPTASYGVARDLKSLSLFDFWGPESAVQRVIHGAVVDRLKVKLNGDVHELEFRGPACDVIDSASFESGQGQLTAFPSEPAAAAFSMIPVAGHLGQAWLGAIPERFFTITEADLTIDNNVDLRAREFGSILPRCFTPGDREVKLGFSLYEKDDVATLQLYQAARQRSPIQMMFQLGQTAGQLMGLYLKGVVPEVPAFDDDEARVQWRFKGCQAQGSQDDELFIAFG